MVIENKVVELIGYDWDYFCSKSDEWTQERLDEFKNILECTNIETLEDIFIKYLDKCSAKEARSFANIFWYYGIQDYYNKTPYFLIALLCLKMDLKNWEDEDFNIFLSIYSVLAKEDYLACNPFDDRQFTDEISKLENSSFIEAYLQRFK